MSHRDKLNNAVKSIKRKKKSKGNHQLISEKIEKFDYSSLDPAYFEFDFCFCCCKKSNNDISEILYKNANNYLTEFMDIDTLFVKYREFDMIKKIFFDIDQRKLFEILAKMNNIQKVFSNFDEDKNDLFENNDDIDHLLQLIKKVKERGNEYDLKIIQDFNFLFRI